MKNRLNLTHIFSPADFQASLNYSYVIAYSPANNTEIKKIVDQVAIELNGLMKFSKFKLSEHSDASHLNNYLLAENPMVGIEFKDELKVFWNFNEYNWVFKMIDFRTPKISRRISNMPCGSAPSRPFWFGKLTTSSE
jgi:hypothetical protein